MHSKIIIVVALVAAFAMPAVAAVQAPHGATIHSTHGATVSHGHTNGTNCGGKVCKAK